MKTKTNAFFILLIFCPLFSFTSQYQILEVNDRKEIKNASIDSLEYERTIEKYTIQHLDNSYVFQSLSPHSGNLSVHDRILIQGNQGFSSYNFSGAGTKDSPFLIRNYHISTAGESGIAIQHTSAYFVVENCLIEGIRDASQTQSQAGVDLNNVSNGLIKNNTISHNWRGMYVDESSDVSIENNSIGVLDNFNTSST